MLDLGEEVFDEVAGFIDVRIVLALDFAVGFWGDDGGFSCGFQWFQHPLIGVIGFVSDDGIGGEQRQENIGARQIVGLARSQSKAGRITQSIAGSVDFGGQPAFAASNRLLALFLRAPALC